MNEADESPEKIHFRKHIFYVVLVNVIGGLTVRFSVAKQTSNAISFIWIYQKMSKYKLIRKAARLAEKYSNDISSEGLLQEVIPI